jgi:hypothetical protein
MEIAIDFDGTCVTHEYPYIGDDIGAIPILKQLIEKGHRLILNTMRCNQSPNGIKGYHLKDAENWFKENNISLYGVGANPTQKNWTTSDKCYAHLYIDDAALGIPLIYPESKRPYVDWKEVEKILKEKGIL